MDFKLVNQLQKLNEDNNLFKPSSNDDKVAREEAHILSLGPKFSELTKTSKETT